MKKTVNINLSGIAFVIDEDAYQVLHEYLEKLRIYFKNSEGNEEILTDIEGRIAELLTEKLGTTRSVVTLIDVNEVIGQMGKPEDYMDEEPFQAEETHTSSNHKTESNTQSGGFKKRLYRDTDNSVVGGVCSGVGYYFGIDPVWIRLILAIAMFVYGTGFMLYIILWIIIPAAKTASEKLEMKGEPINISSLGKRVEEELKNVNENLKKDGSYDKIGSSLSTGIERIGNFLLQLFKLIIKGITKIVGIILVFAGGFTSFILMIVIIAIISGTSFIHIGDTYDISLSDLTSLVFIDNSDAYLLILGGFLLAIVPVIGILYGGVSLLTNVKNLPRGFGWSLFGLWVIGLITSLYSGIITANEFTKSQTVRSIEPVKNPADTIYLTINNQVYEDVNVNPFPSVNGNSFNYDPTSGLISSGDIELNVIKSNIDSPVIEVKKSARGKDVESSRSRAESIFYNYTQTGNTVAFDPIFSFQDQFKWRNQNVRILVKIPEGTTVYLEQGLEDIIYDIKNTTNTYDLDMINHYWTMTPEGLSNKHFVDQSNEESELDESIN